LVVIPVQQLFRSVCAGVRVGTYVGFGVGLAGAVVGCCAGCVATGVMLLVGVALLLLPLNPEMEQKTEKKAKDGNSSKVIIDKSGDDTDDQNDVKVVDPKPLVLE